MTQSTATAAQQIEFGPEPSRWAGLIASPDRDARCAEIRRELGLPTDRPIVMSGHQGGLWHPGIAAKLMAARAIAERTGAAVAWIVVDTDPGTPLQIDVPVRDASGALDIRSVDASADHPLETSVPGYPALIDRLAAVHASLQTHAAEHSDAVRATLAAIDALPGDKPIVLMATQLAATRGFRSCVERVSSTADHVLRLYNAAVAQHPSAGVQTLHAGRDPELPFWSVGSDGVRRAALASDPPGSTRWPRALALTGILRAFVCDLFLHGTGGRAYEPINDAWLPEAVDATLAPFVTTTATLRLRFDGHPMRSNQEAAHAAWLAHHARHHPGLFDDQQTQRKRDALVASIASAPMRSEARAALYRDLCAMLEHYRHQHASDLRALADAAQRAALIASESQIRDRRTFAAVLHDPTDLERLDRSIADAFDGRHP